MLAVVVVFDCGGVGDVEKGCILGGNPGVWNRQVGIKELLCTWLRAGRARLNAGSAAAPVMVS